MIVQFNWVNWLPTETNQVTCHHRYIKSVEVLFKKPNQAAREHVLTIRRVKLEPWIIIELSLDAPDVPIACFSWCSIYSQYSQLLQLKNIRRHWAAHLTHDFAKNQRTNITTSIFAYRTIFSFISQGQLIVQEAPWHVPHYTLLLEDEAYVYILSSQNKIQVRAPPFVVCGKKRIATINAYSGLSSIPLKLTFPCNLRV